MTIVLKKRARQGILSLIDYLVSIGYPANAESYLQKIESFIWDLPHYHHIYQTCQRQSWQQRGYRCAVFDGKYIIPFQIRGDQLVVMNFLHGSRIH